MTSKQFLEQAIRIEHDMIAHLSEMDNLHTIASATGAIRYDTDKVIHSVTEARFERPTIKAADLENVVRAEIRELLDDLGEIREAIAQIEDTDVRDVIRMRYLGNDDLDVIAYKLKISRKTVFRRMERGYSEIAHITGYPAPVRNRLPAEERHGDAKRIMRDYFGEEA